MTTAPETPDQRARRRTVHGWAFKALPEAEEKAILAFLAGGDVPEGYERLYALARRQLGLEEADDGNEDA
jgi:hypothetical protein